MLKNILENNSFLEIRVKNFFEIKNFRVTR
jgi:hypothetical protein